LHAGVLADKQAVEAAENVWRPLGELLVTKGLVSRDELERALIEQEESGRLLGAILVDRGFVSGPALAIALAEQYGVELATERGFGTGLWAEIDRRHRAGRVQDDDNVLQFEPPRLPPLEAVPDADPDPLLATLRDENRRLYDENEQLKREASRLRVVEIPEPPSEHLLFVPTPARYLMLERIGPPPEPGVEVEVPDVDGRFVVTKLGRAPFPAEGRPCAFLLPRP
jgi:hypothetical protein